MASLPYTVVLYGYGLCDILKVLDAVNLLQRYKTALPLVLRQIEVHVYIYVCVLVYFYMYVFSFVDSAAIEEGIRLNP